jgi:hypothetical protein
VLILDGVQIKGIKHGDVRVQGAQPALLSR